MIKFKLIGRLATKYKGLITEYDDLRNDSDRQLLYSITFTKNKTSIGGSIVTKHEVEYDDTVHCVSVPTKMLVVRRNDVVGVSGNTSIQLCVQTVITRQWTSMKHINVC